MIQFRSTYAISKFPLTTIIGSHFIIIHWRPALVGLKFPWLEWKLWCSCILQLMLKKHGRGEAVHPLIESVVVISPCRLYLYPSYCEFCWLHACSSLPFLQPSLFLRYQSLKFLVWVPLWPPRLQVFPLLGEAWKPTHQCSFLSKTS